MKYNDIFSLKKNRIIPGIIRLISLLLTVLFVGHLFGCLFLGLATLLKDLNIPTWMDNYKDGILVDEHILTKYSFAFYWAVTTMTTVSYFENNHLKKSYY
jgi:hypothetical protein